MTDWNVLGPYVKDEYGYLNPSSWYEPNPDDQFGYSLGGIAWYYVLRRADSRGGRHFAARTPEAAEAALRNHLHERRAITATWLTPEQVRALDDDTWRCPGCGRCKQEVPVAHDYDQRAGTCGWIRPGYRTRWWPDGLIHDDYWSADMLEQP